MTKILPALLEPFKLKNPRKGTETFEDNPQRDSIKPFKLKNPRKGTETLLKSVAIGALTFKLKNPRKGTETLYDEGFWNIRKPFKLKNPRKGTETTSQLSYCQSQNNLSN